MRYLLFSDNANLVQRYDSLGDAWRELKRIESEIGLEWVSGLVEYDEDTSKACRGWS